VPDFAIVPMSSTTSSRLIPIPLSRTVSVRSAGAVDSAMCRSAASMSRSSVNDASRTLSSASEAFESSSLRKTSLVE